MDSQKAITRESVAQTVLPSRLLPRVSFRFMMLLTAFSAVAIAVVAAADQGGTYAIAASAGLFFAITLAISFALLFLVSWSVAHLPRAVGAVFVVVGGLLLVSRLLLASAPGALLGSLAFLTETAWILCFQLVGWFLIIVPFRDQDDSIDHSPFAAEQLPPQIYAPRESSH